MRVIGLLVAGVMMLGACQSTVSPSIEKNRVNAQSGQALPLHGDVLQLTNGHRAQAGLPPLRNDGQLRAAAAQHGADLQRNGMFSHSGSDGSDVGDRVLKQGYQYCVAAENIAMGQIAPEDVMRDWMNSPGHRKNILDKSVTDIGVHREGDLWVMVLARRC